MTDLLLLTRRQRLERFGARFGIAVAPTLALVLTALALGAEVTALAITVAGLGACMAVGTNARTKVGAAVAGVVIAVLLFGFQLFIAWMGTHPILPGS